jgi:hypothetical protein
VVPLKRPALDNTASAFATVVLQVSQATALSLPCTFTPASVFTGGSGFIIGDTTMRNYYLVFDLAKKRIGWGDVNKDQCGSI